MATPYFQLRLDSVVSTQDVARENLEELPLLVIAASQTGGRGRSGSEWRNADRSLAVSLIFRHEKNDLRPFSLMAGVAAVNSLAEVKLKWPNDVVRDDDKVGGILVERTDETTVIGLGVNLWWADTPQGMAGMYESDPGPHRHAELGALWGAELMELIESDVWPIDEYRRNCVTIGQPITWDPNGRGKAVDVAADGALIVESGTRRESLHSGAIRHLRTS